MAEEKNMQEAEAEEMELELDDLEKVTGGSMKNVYVKKTSDITENMRKNV